MNLNREDSGFWLQKGYSDVCSIQELPAEILSKILALVATIDLEAFWEQDEAHKDLLSIMLVCRRWYEATSRQRSRVRIAIPASGSPLTHEEIELMFKGTNESPRGVGIAVKPWCDCIHQYPPSVCVWSNQTGMAQFLGHSPRLHEMALSFQSSRCFNTFLSGLHSPNSGTLSWTSLSSLSITINQVPTESYRVRFDSFPLTPNLTILSLKFNNILYRLEIPSLLLQNLTTFNLECQRTLTDLMLDILEHCSNLRTLKLVLFLNHSHEAYSGANRTKVVLPRLRSLVLGIAYHNPVMQDFLSTLSFPTLSNLRIMIPVPWYLYEPNVCITFLRTALDCLGLLNPSGSVAQSQSLHISARFSQVRIVYELDAGMLYDIISALPSVRHLHLEDFVLNDTNASPQCPHAGGVGIRSLFSLLQSIDLTALQDRVEGDFNFKSFFLGMEAQLESAKMAGNSEGPNGQRRKLTTVTVRHLYLRLWDTMSEKATGAIERLSKEHGVVVERFLVDDRS
ncbi:hypothetical protein NMY22_g1932 [Coprinellus aureogranulatus]|nr:hypothetical protein NMY22_g1932 [Coprinellus aureogranulatus]